MPRDKEGNLVHAKKEEKAAETAKEGEKVDEKTEVAGEKKGSQAKMGDTVAMR